MGNLRGQILDTIRGRHATDYNVSWKEDIRIEDRAIAFGHSILKLVEIVGGDFHTGTVG